RRVVVDHPPSAELDRAELDLNGPGLDDVGEHRDLAQRGPAAGADREVEIVQSDRSQGQPPPPDALQAEVDLEPGELEKMGTGLARSRGRGDIADDHAPEPGLDGNRFDLRRALERRAERDLQALAGELRPPDADGEP